MILKMYEDACLKHVVKLQIKDKTFSMFVRGNPTLERDNPELQEPSKGIVKSSLLGQDPWGDEPIPSEEDQDDEEAYAYTKVQILLKNVQDQNYSYLVAHLERILHEDIYLDVRKKEVEYANNEGGIRTRTHRNRMPWKEYKTIIYQLLPVPTGLHELRIFMTLNRENGESAQSWVRRLTEGKQLLEEKGITLPDALYVRLAMNYTASKEKTTVSERVGSAQSRGRKTRQKLL